MNYSVINHLDAAFSEKIMRLEGAETTAEKIRLLLEKPHYANQDHRGTMRGVIGSRYKFARYFSPTQHHTPDNWESLMAFNDIELYDTYADPGELHNLAQNPENHRELILTLNAQLNRLLNTEVGDDDGSYRRGPEHLWRL